MNKILIAFLALAVWCSAAYAEAVKVIDVKGAVTVVSSGQATPAGLTKGAALNAGDRIKTGKGGSCVLSYGDSGNSIIGVSETSEVMVIGDDRVKLEILDAKIYAKVKNMPLGSAFEIRTPTAVCGARGTGLGVEGDDDMTRAASYENDIYLVNEAGEELEINQGFYRTVDDSGEISEEAEVPEEEMNGFNAWEEETAGDGQVTGGDEEAAGDGEVTGGDIEGLGDAEEDLGLDIEAQEINSGLGDDEDILEDDGTRAGEGQGDPPNIQY